MWHTAKYGDPYLEVSALHLPIQVHTHTMNTHPEQWAAIYAAGARGSVGGSVPCSRAPLRGIKGGESAVHSLPTRQSLPDRVSNPQPFN